MSKAFYITTTLPYVNAPLHLGHATEIIRADAVARYHQLIGDQVFFNTGTDEHGLKISEAAAKAGQEVQHYVDQCAVLFKTTLQQFGVSPDTHYIRTTDPHHLAAAQEFWRRCDQRGYIYKKNYQAKYCVGCEAEKTDSELIAGKCPIHDRVPELIDEENYFFKLSVFSEPLLALYDARPDFIVPAYRLNELREFIKRGLQDFSISRLQAKMGWGIPVPGDPPVGGQVMYVWFDALVNYLSTLGWPDKTGDFQKFWVGGTPVQYCGKDNVRFQGLMWQAMLLAAGLPATHTIVVDGFILGEGGVKMSKTLGNVIDPLAIVKDYGTDALRYFILRHCHPFEDTAVSADKLTEWYNANLANGLGNLVSRVLKMAATNDIKLADEEMTTLAGLLEPGWESLFKKHKESLAAYDLATAMDAIWQSIAQADQSIQVKAPFKKIKTNPDEAKQDIKILLQQLRVIGWMLEPFMPATAQIIEQLIKENKLPDQPLFPRKD